MNVCEKCFDQSKHVSITMKNDGALKIYCKNTHLNIDTKSSVPDYNYSCILQKELWIWTSWTDMKLNFYTDTFLVHIYIAEIISLKLVRGRDYKPCCKKFRLKTKAVTAHN